MVNKLIGRLLYEESQHDEVHVRGPLVFAGLIVLALIALVILA